MTRDKQFFLCVYLRLFASSDHEANESLIKFIILDKFFNILGHKLAQTKLEASPQIDDYKNTD